MSSGSKVVEGVFAINKPKGISSAGVLRKLQDHFNPSKLFAPWLEAERRRLAHERRTSGGRGKKFKLDKVKMGHGGTLDPEASGVLVVGVGSGTKRLNGFLECTKSYDCVVLFGCATDTYDGVGKVVGTAAYAHVTRAAVEDALRARFAGRIEQVPPVFSALKFDGKKLYELAREGKEIPEIKPRPVEVVSMELLEWYEGGTHDYKFPEAEAPAEEKAAAERLMGAADASTQGGATKRKRDDDAEPASTEAEDNPEAKKAKASSEPLMSGALSAGEEQAASATTEQQPSEVPVETSTEPRPPAALLRMTVTSGFYVRSLCHDLGRAVGSLAFMASLVRTRQGDFELGKNTLEYEDLEKGEETWAPKVERMLEQWQATKGSEPASERKPQPRQGGNPNNSHQKNKKQTRNHDAPRRTRRNSSSEEDN